MTEKKEAYYKFKKESDDNFGGLAPEISNYVEKLEKEIRELRGGGSNDR